MSRFRRHHRIHQAIGIYGSFLPIFRLPGRMMDGIGGGLFLLVTGCMISLWVTGCLGAAPDNGSEIGPFESWSLSAIRVHGSDTDPIREVEMKAPVVVSEERIASILDEILGDLRDGAYLLSRIRGYEWKPDSLSRSVTLDVFVDRGPSCSVSSISLVGNRSLDNDTFARLTGITVGVPLTESILERGLEEVARWYADNGFPYSEIDVAGFKVSRVGDVDIELVFEEGRRTRIGNVFVRGNRVTREGVVLRQFGVRPNDTFSLEEIQRGRERLAMTDLYSDVGEVRFMKSERSHKVDLEIRVKEGKPNTFGGAAGIVPGPGGSIQPTGSLDLALGNLWGTGRKMSARWLGRGGGNSQLDLCYREPWIAGSPFSGEFRFTQELRDTAFSRIEFVLTGLGSIGRGFGVKFGMDSQSVFSALDGGPGGGKSGRLSLLLGAYRSAVFERTSGRQWRMDIEFLLGRRSISGDKVGEVEGRGWISLTPWSRSREDFRVKAGGRFIRSPLRPVPAYHLFSVGGGETVRGYAEDRIWGNRAFWGRSEFSFGVQGASRYLLFYDLGIVDKSGDRWGVRVLHGFGAGLRVQSRIGVMKIDYALNPNLGPLEGRLHTGWTQEF